MLLNSFTVGQACSRLFYCRPRVLFGCFTVGQRWLFYCRSRMLLDSFTVGQGCCLVVLL